MIELTSDNFQEEVVGSEIPVLVDFWAPWCGPCKMMTPVIEELNEEHSDKIKICKINIDEVQDYPEEFAVNAIPALILVKDGVIVKKEIGLRTKKAIVAIIEEVL